MRDGVRHRQRRARPARRRGGAARRPSSRARSPAPRSTSSPTEPYSGPLLELDTVVVTPHLAASTDEAQDRAGVIVAEQVAAALEGGLVSNAVNIPAIGAEDMEVLGPYVPLAAKLGRLALELAGGRADEIVITAYGGIADYDTRLLTVAALQRRVPGPRRPAGELRQRAADRARARHRSARGALAVGARLHEPPARRGRTAEASGRASRARRSAARTARGSCSALGFDIELELAPLLVLFRYDDVPGVIGRVGTLFGDAGVNIANMTVSRTRRGGKALMVLSVDTRPPAELVERIRAEGFDDARVDRALSLGRPRGFEAAHESRAQPRSAPSRRSSKLPAVARRRARCRAVAVARREQEGRAVRPDLLVLLERRLDALGALRVAALADELGRAGLEALCVLRDALVHLAERAPRSALSVSSGSLH